MIFCPDLERPSIKLDRGSAWTDVFSGGVVYAGLIIILTRSSDGTHLGDLSQSPAASRVAAALHLGVLAVQLGGAAAVGQRREAGANPLI